MKYFQMVTWLRLEYINEEIMVSDRAAQGNALTWKIISLQK